MNNLAISDCLPISGRRICSIGNRGHHNFGDELILVGLMKLLLTNKFESKIPTFYVSCGNIDFIKKFHQYFFESDYLVNVGYIQEIPHGLRSFLRLMYRGITQTIDRMYNKKEIGRYYGIPTDEGGLVESILDSNPNNRPGFIANIANNFNMREYFRCDAFIVGGGELFTEETPGSYLYRFWSLLPYWIRKIFFWNTKLYLMGGFQKPISRYNRVIAWLITKCADGCYMRDEESVQDILAIHSGKKHVEWFIDTSYFAFAGADTIRSNHHQNRPNHQQKHIIINSNPLSGKRTDELVGIAKDYMHRGYDVYFLPAFFTSNPQQDDMKVYEYLINKIVGTRGNVSASKLKLLDRRNRDEFLIIFHSAEKIFCSRLHVFLIASFLGLAVQAYPYQKKIAKNMSILKRCGILK